MPQLHTDPLANFDRGAVNLGKHEGRDEPCPLSLDDTVENSPRRGDPLHRSGIAHCAKQPTCRDRA